MNLPDDCTLAYTVNHESKYYRLYREATGTMTGRSLGVAASASGGGVAWEFVVEEHRLGKGAVQLQIFDDAFAALAQIPEFFAALAEQEPTSLDAVRAILDELGAVDQTTRAVTSAP